MWLHGGTGNFIDGIFLYVKEELKEALHYARLKGGNVYKLKDEYNHIVDWYFTRNVVLCIMVANMRSKFYN